MSDTLKSKSNKEEEILARQREIASRLNFQAKAASADQPHQRDEVKSRRTAAAQLDCSVLDLTGSNYDNDLKSDVRPIKVKGPLAFTTSALSVKDAKTEAVDQPRFGAAQEMQGLAATAAAAASSSSSATASTASVALDQSTVIDLTSPAPLVHAEKKSRLKRKECADATTLDTLLQSRSHHPSRLLEDAKVFSKKLKPESPKTIKKSPEQSKRSSPHINVSAFKRAPIRKKTPTVLELGSKSNPMISGMDRTLTNHAHASRNLPPVYPCIEFEDFWRDVRDWDFLTDLNTLMQMSSQKPKNHSHQPIHNSSKLHRINTKKGLGQEDDDDIQILAHHHPQTIPLTFHNPRQYKALWAPHCFSESRAQLLSDFAADIHYWKNCDRPMQARDMKTHHASNKKRTAGASQGPIRIKASTLKRDVGTSTDFINIKIETIPSEPDTDMSFMANDIVLLTSSLTFLSLAANGKLTEAKLNNDADDDRVTHGSAISDSPSHVHCIVGHSEFSRRSIDGLLLKVSRNHWLQFSSSKQTSKNPLNSDTFFLVRLGSNITALREFTALSRIESMPLLPYLLNIHSGKGYNDADNHHPKELLASMGGQEALGKGFVTYIERKYNSSQISAIAAAAKEYGDGGFTLIKGNEGEDTKNLFMSHCLCTH